MPTARRTTPLALTALAAGAILLSTTGFKPRERTICGSRERVPAAAAEHLEKFVRRHRFRQVRATVGTIWRVHVSGRLPRCYLTKGQARRRGWRPGRNLWRVARGHSIGGNRFGNRERRLPLEYRYVEADLDFRGGRRGAKRLVFARSTRGRWRIWITTDHYRSFHRVPPAPSDARDKYDQRDRHDRRDRRGRRDRHHRDSH